MTALRSFSTSAALGAAVGGTFSLLDTTGRIVLNVAGGIAIGLAVGWLVRQVRRRIDDPPTEIAIAVLSGYLAYLPATAARRLRRPCRGHDRRLHGLVHAGVDDERDAAVGRRVLGDPRVPRQRARSSGWSACSFGHPRRPLRSVLVEARRVLRAGVARRSSLTRLASSCRSSPTFPAGRSESIREHDPYPPWQWPALISWVGIRGAVSLVAALALPNGFPDRELIIFLTFTVIVATLVLQGLTLPAADPRCSGSAMTEAPSARTPRRGSRRRRQRWRGSRSSSADGAVRPETAERLRGALGFRRDRFRARLDDGDDGMIEEQSPSYQRVMRELLDAERAALIALRNEPRHRRQRLAARPARPRPRSREARFVGARRGSRFSAPCRRPTTSWAERRRAGGARPRRRGLRARAGRGVARGDRAPRTRELNAFVASAPSARSPRPTRSGPATRGRSAACPSGSRTCSRATEGLPTTRGQPRRSATGSPTTTRAHVRRLREAGAIVVGKTNTPELGLRPVTENARFGATRNPLGPDALGRRLVGRQRGRSRGRAWSRSPTAATSAARSASPRRAAASSASSRAAGRVSIGPDFGDIGGGHAGRRRAHAHRARHRDRARRDRRLRAGRPPSRSRRRRSRSPTRRARGPGRLPCACRADGAARRARRRRAARRDAARGRSALAELGHDVARGGARLGRRAFADELVDLRDRRDAAPRPRRSSGCTAGPSTPTLLEPATRALARRRAAGRRSSTTSRRPSASGRSAAASCAVGDGRASCSRRRSRACPRRSARSSRRPASPTTPSASARSSGSGTSPASPRSRCRCTRRRTASRSASSSSARTAATTCSWAPRRSSRTLSAGSRPAASRRPRQPESLLRRQGGRVGGAAGDPLAQLGVRAHVLRGDAEPAPIDRPRISMNSAGVVATRSSDSAGSTRTRTPPWPLAATAMLPPIRKASPPNIFRSVRSGSSPIRSRMRPASASS